MNKIDPTNAAKDVDFARPYLAGSVTHSSSPLDATSMAEEPRARKKSSVKRQRLMMLLITILVLLGIFIFIAAGTGAGFLAYYLSKKSKIHVV